MNELTVKELIEKLKEYPENINVHFGYKDKQGNTITKPPVFSEFEPYDKEREDFDLGIIIELVH